MKDPSASSQSLAVSIGVFIYDPIMAEANLTTGQKGFGIRYLPYSERKEYLGYCALLIILAVIVFVIALTCARIHLVRMAFRLDDAICTQSDFGLYIQDMVFEDDNYGKKGMEEEVADYLA